MNDAGSTCSRTGIGSVIQAWRKVVQKVESKSQSKAAAAMWQKPAADWQLKTLASQGMATS